jgi:hypothetical protein
MCLQHTSNDPPTGKSLSTLAQQFIQLQEDHLGRNAKNPPFTRLPVGYSTIFPSFPVFINSFSRGFVLNREFLRKSDHVHRYIFRCISSMTLVLVVAFVTSLLQCTAIKQTRVGEGMYQFRTGTEVYGTVHSLTFSQSCAVMYKIAPYCENS